MNDMKTPARATFGFLGAGAGKSRSDRRRRRLRFEPLEDRLPLATFLVTSLADSGPGSLREAIDLANANAPFSHDEVKFDPALEGRTIGLNSSLPVITQSLSIAGPGFGPGSIIIDGQNNGRVFEVRTAVNFSNLTITRGNAGADDGGGILATNVGLPVLDGVAVTNCSARSGGGIESRSGLHLRRSIVADNQATERGGGITFITGGQSFNVWSSLITGNKVLDGPGGGIFTDGSDTTQIRSTTITGNMAGGPNGHGGGVGLAGGDSIFFANTTIAGNTSGGEGGGVHVNANVVFDFVTIANNMDLSASATGAGGLARAGGQVTLRTSVIAENQHVLPANNNVHGNPILNEVTVTDNDVLGPLQDNGGFAPTMLPHPETLGDIIENATTRPLPLALTVVDQRGLARGIDFDQDGVVTRDRGAVEVEVNPDRRIAFVVGADGISAPTLKVYDEDRQLLAELPAFPSGPTPLATSVRVALGDVNADGVQDIITAPGPGAGPLVRVISGATLTELYRFFAYDPRFTGGVTVAAGDVNGDGFDDIVTGAGAGGGPHVRVVDGRTQAQLYSFFAFNSAFRGGVNVAAGRLNSDVFADIVVGAGRGGGPHVRAFSGTDLKKLVGFFAYDQEFTGGVYVAVADFDNHPSGGMGRIITGAGAGGGPQVRVYLVFQISSTRFTVAGLLSFFAYAAGFTGGVRVSSFVQDGDGRADIITGPGPAGGPDVRILDGVSTQEIDRFFAFEGNVPGIFVGG
jgi:hypothetical protein